MPRVKTLESLETKINKNKKLNKSDEASLRTLLTSDRYVAHVSVVNGIDRTITITSNSIDGFMKLIKNRKTLELDNVFGSDKMFEINFEGLKEIKFEKIEAKKIVKNKDGSFFKYLNTTNIDLTGYQIVRECDDGEQINSEQCLLFCFKTLGIEESKINNIKLSIPSFNIPKNKFNDICDIIKKKIILHYIASSHDNIIKKELYGKSYTETIEIAIYENHYFVYEDTKYNKFFIDNYEELKDLEDCYNIKRTTKKNNKTYYEFGEKRCSSLYLVNKLFNDGYFKKDTVSINKITSSATLSSDNIPLDNIEEEQDIPISKSKAIKEKSNIFYADCESVVKYEIHEILMMGIIEEKGTEPYIIVRKDKNDLKFIDLFFNFIKNNSVDKGIPIVYFHNLKYDWMGLLKKYVNCKSCCQKEGNIYSVRIIHYGYEIELRDSYKLMNTSLSKFSDVFGLNNKKQEAIAYEFYDFENIHKTKHSVAEYMSYFKKEEDKIIFINNMKEEKFEYDGVNFNASSYYKYYLKYDCIILKDGMNKYVDIVKEITSKDGKDPMYLHNSLTISSLTNKFMKENEAFDDVYSLSGNIREYVSNAIYGGRVNALEEFKKVPIEGCKMNDFDGVSLYPSAIKRMCEEMGIPKGRAKVIKNFDMNVDYFICRIKILKINKKQQNPFIAVKTKDGIDYINEIKKETIVTVDKITLQDYITFHNIDYEFIDGIYWNNGFNKKMGELIKELFESRIDYKKKLKETGDVGNNTLQEVLKLMMNSSYGKTILKKTNEETLYIDNNTYDKENKKMNDGNDNINNYIYNHFNTIKEYKKVNDNQTEVTKLKLDNSFNMAHVGVLILSYSKRIMNEVMGLASDNNINIYYQDTDSMHIDDKNIKPLQKLFYEKYNREIIGTNLGQFHSDFNLKGSVIEPVAVKSLFLGKKSYIDVLEGKDKEGNKITGYHYRMKGVSELGLQYEVEKNFNGDYYAMYKYLASGKEIEFILNPYEYKPSFEYINGGIRTRKTEEFKRIVSF